MTETIQNAQISLEIGAGPDHTLNLHLSGRLDVQTAAQVWQPSMRWVRRAHWRKIRVDAAGLDFVDQCGIGFFLQLRQLQLQRQTDFQIDGLNPRFLRLLERFERADLFIGADAASPKLSLIEKVGQWGAHFYSDLRAILVFSGEAAALLAAAVVSPRRIRWLDVAIIARKAGVEALPILALIGFLIGLIMSFQSAVTLRQFGGQTYIPNLLGLTMVRELGPLMAAILLAARSGSSFAAEIGTMKVNEEIDALITMGLRPVRFLALPRMIAAVALMPFIVIFFIYFSFVGGAMVMVSLGFPLAVFTERVFAYVHLSDFLGGMFKALVFSLLVAGIACQRGQATGSGASAVGDATTQSVVAGIILIAVADGVLAVLYYYLGI